MILTVLGSKNPTSPPRVRANRSKAASAAPHTEMTVARAGEEDEEGEEGTDTGRQSEGPEG